MLFFVLTTSKDSTEEVAMKRNKKLLIAIASAGITGRTLAKRAGIDDTTVSRLLNDHSRCKPATAAVLAKALDSTPEKLGLRVWKGGPIDAC